MKYNVNDYGVTCTEGEGIYELEEIIKLLSSACQEFSDTLVWHFDEPNATRFIESLQHMMSQPRYLDKRQVAPSLNLYMAPFYYKGSYWNHDDHIQTATWEWALGPYGNRVKFHPGKVHMTNESWEELINSTIYQYQPYVIGAENPYAKAHPDVIPIRDILQQLSAKLKDAPFTSYRRPKHPAYLDESLPIAIGKYEWEGGWFEPIVHKAFPCSVPGPYGLEFSFRPFTTTQEVADKLLSYLEFQFSNPSVTVTIHDPILGKAYRCVDGHVEECDLGSGVVKNLAGYSVTVDGTPDADILPQIAEIIHLLDAEREKHRDELIAKTIYQSWEFVDALSLIKPPISPMPTESLSAKSISYYINNLSSPTSNILGAAYK